MANPFDIKEIVLMIALAATAGGWFNTDITYKQEQALLNQKLQANDILIKQLHRAYIAKDSAYRHHILNYDSLQKLRDENNTTTYDLSADSIEQLWADRFNQ